MKSKYLSKIVLVLLVCVSHAIAGEFRWPGDASLVLPGRENDPVLVSTGPGVRQVNSLRFDNEANEGGREGAASARFLRLSLSQLAPLSEEATIAAFVHPDRKKGNDDFIASKSDSRSDWNGYRLFKVWEKWGLEIGDGASGAKIYSGDKLTIKAWQHLAVVIKGGVVTFYRDGVAVKEERLPVNSVMLPDTVALGAGPQGYLPFHGLMTGVYISDKALDGEGVLNLMRSVTE